MIGSATIAAAALFFIVAALALSGRLIAQNASPDTKTSRTLLIPFPAEMLPQVFSANDWRFVRGVESLYVRKLFLRERKAVALKWVAETSACINIVMREHALAARQSTNLNPVTELRLFARYVSLLLLCGSMCVAIRVAGPARLGRLAQLTQKTFERIAQSLHLLPTPAQTHDALAGVRT